MIRIEPPASEWQVEITSLKPTWWARALQLTEANRRARTYLPASTIWSEIKPLYVTLQRKKCAYCERRLGSNGIEWDVEHFRPKQRVDAWESSTGTVKIRDRASSSGYYLMAYNPRNYLASCKVCNSVYKRNYFPVRKRRRLSSDGPDILAREEPYLLNPLDGADQNPEELIEFHGPIPRARSTDVVGKDRALVTIELLGLGRSDLVEERCQRIVDLWVAIRLANSGDPIGERAVDLSCDAASPHANCCRSFLALAKSDPARAGLLVDDALKLIHSQS